MSYEGVSTLSKTGPEEYNLLIQNEHGKVLFRKRGMTFREAVAEIENRMYMKEGDEDRSGNGGCE